MHGHASTALASCACPVPREAAVVGSEYPCCTLTPCARTLGDLMISRAGLLNVPVLTQPRRAQTITVTVNVSDPTDADAVAFLVPYNADRNITAPQKRQWCMNGTAGADYLTTGTTALKCAVTPSS